MLFIYIFLFIFDLFTLIKQVTKMDNNPFSLSLSEIYNFN
jgi:hypothetical protein